MVMLTYFSVRWWALLIAVALHFIMGMLWYGPFFGKKWMEANSLSDEDIRGGSSMIYVYSAVMAVLITFGIAFILNAIGVDTIAQGLGVVFIVWVTLHLAPFVNHLNFEQRPKSLIVITTCYDLVVWLLTAILIVISS